MNTHKIFRILYVTRNEGDCLLLRALLDFPFIEITMAETVAEAVRQARDGHFDLYLLETRLPDGDGFDLCRAMREIAPDTPVVFYTGDAGENYKQKGLDAGAHVYLAKPYVDSLTRTLTQFIM